MNRQRENLLQQRHIQPTAMRLLVLEYLLHNKQAVSLKQMETDFWHADRSTLFRTLKTFEEKKLVHRIEDGSGHAKYALCAESCECRLEDVHLHFFCTTCEKTYCLEDQLIPLFSLPPSFRPEHANLVIKGLCADC